VKAPKVKFNDYIQGILAHRAKKNKIIRYFPDSDLRCGHEGLEFIAKKSGVETRDMKLGEFIVFMNSKMDKMKIFTAGNLIVYQKSFNGSRIDPRIISLIPKYFRGTELDYTAAVGEVLERR